MSTFVDGRRVVPRSCPVTVQEMKPSVSFRYSNNLCPWVILDIVVAKSISDISGKNSGLVCEWWRQQMENLRSWWTMERRPFHTIERDKSMLTSHWLQRRIFLSGIEGSSESSVLLHHKTSLGPPTLLLIFLFCNTNKLCGNLVDVGTARPSPHHHRIRHSCPRSFPHHCLHCSHSGLSKQHRNRMMAPDSQTAVVSSIWRVGQTWQGFILMNSSERVLP